jgi:predicted CXXCH cytochrome family protein
LLNPISAARVIPGELIPAAKAAHGAEAILAVLAILIWHFYNVHIKTLNMSMFTGHLHRHQMEEEHGLELAEIENGVTPGYATPAEIKKRRRVFVPLALLATMLMLAGVYWLLTSEDTALATAPRSAQVQVFAPITPTPTAVKTATAGASQPTTSGAIPAGAGSTEMCLSCHGPFEKVFKASAGYKFYDGSIVNPHNTVELKASNPHASGTGIVECTKCHTPHPQPLASVKDVASADLNYCFGCHHQGVFTPCIKCHEGYK